MVKSITTEYKTLSVAEAAYLAGLIDGEGCFFISKVHKKTQLKEFNYHPVMGVVNTCPVMIDLCHTYGGHYQAQDHTVNWKRVYRWFFTIPMLKHYLPQIYPYFKIKVEQSKVMLEALQHFNGTGIDKTPEDYTALENCRHHLIDLNARGKKKGRLD